MRCALIVAAGVCALLPASLAAQSPDGVTQRAAGFRALSSAELPDDETGGASAETGSGPSQTWQTFDTRQRAGILPTAGEAAAGTDRTGAPLRRAYQSPDIFRTPNPTPLEQVPPPDEPYAPRMMPGQSYHQSVPHAKPEPPLPPLAPLVNMRISETWLPGGDDQLGVNDVDLRATLAFSKNGPFITPGYGVHFFDGPTTTDVPGTLYDAYLDFRWKKPLNDDWAIELAFTPSWYGDGENDSSDAWRFISTALVFYQATPEWQLMAGLMYLDRFDINWFPIFGAIWADPDGECDWRYEFVFPRPKFAYRVLRCDNKDQWAYFAGEFGGGAWAVERTTGQADMLAYRDWRAYLGYESKVKDFSAISWFAEAGIVFNRQVEYDSGRGDFDPDPTGMLRFGVWY